MTSDDAFFLVISMASWGQKGLETLQGTRTCYRLYTLAKFYSSVSYIEMYGIKVS